MRKLLLLFLVLSSLSALAQKPDSLSTEVYEFEPDMIAKRAVSKIVQYTGLTPNFVIIPDNNIATAQAFLKNNKRIITYNPKFIEKLNDKTKTNWGAVSVLAHEIGHHLAGHTLLKNQSPGNELIADKFSGFILFQMGATLNDAKLALNTIGDEMDTTKHPPKNARVNAITEGWEEAKNLRNTTAFSDKKLTNDTNTTKFVFQCNFKGDDNVYFVDSKDNIIWYDNYGKPIIIGAKKTSTTSKYVWIYKYSDNFYGVDSKGKIWNETTYGSSFIIGKVKDLKKK